MMCKLREEAASVALWSRVLAGCPVQTPEERL